VTLWFASWRSFGGRAPIHAIDLRELNNLGSNEARFYLGAGIAELLLCAILAELLRSHWPKGLDHQWATLLARPAAAYAGFALVAGALALAAGLGLLGGHPITEDEKTYLFQADLLRHGQLTVSVPPGAAVFWQPFIVMFPDHWTGQYGWAHPATLALAQLLGTPNLVTALETAAIVLFTAKLAHEYTRDARVGLVAGALAMTSPHVVLTGGTLLNANLAAACAAVSLWAMVRIARRAKSPLGGKDRAACILLGLATGIGIHTRVLDEAMIIAGGGAVMFLDGQRAPGRLIRALGPAVLVSLPFVALLPVINHAAYGNWWRTGHAAFNDPHGWGTMGFGNGPFSFPQTWHSAVAKTLSVFVRLSFYTTGTPLALGLGILACLLRRSRLAIAPALPVALYVVGYFLYMGASIDSTGPVYYLSLAPVLIGWAAMGATGLHDTLRERVPLARLVPGFLCAQAVTAAVVFWPAQINYLLDDVGQAKSCEDMVEAAGVTRGLVFAFTDPANGVLPRDASTWYRRPPLSFPPFDAPILYAQPTGRAGDASTMERFAGDRPVFLEWCWMARPNGLRRYDPRRGAYWSLDGSGEIKMPD
jgi:hypothetical protein